MKTPLIYQNDLVKLRLMDALEAIRAHRDARAGGAPSEEIERLRRLADSLYDAVLDCQLLVAESQKENLDYQFLIAESPQEKN